MSPADSGAERAIDMLTRLRAAAPLVQCITNFVAMDFTANALLAFGGSPAMVHAATELPDFVPLIGALTVNIGTLSPDWVAGMRLAAALACRHGKPWVLDPVGAGATPYRTQTALMLAEAGPSVIRGNGSEILALAGTGDGGKGVDSRHGSDEAAGAADALARRHRCVVVVTGAVDLITDGSRHLTCANGHPLMTRITASGCALSALIGAGLAVEPDPLLAAGQVTALFGLAGELAAARAEGPGSLRWRLLDSLHGLTPDAIRAGLKLA